MTTDRGQQEKTGGIGKQTKKKEKCFVLFLF
jgi:hypothetical protein